MTPCLPAYARRLASLVIAAAVVTGAAATARADRTIVFVTSPVKDSERPVIDAEAQQAVTGGGWTPVAAALDPAARAGLERCLADTQRGGCVAKVIEQERADRALMLRVSLEGEKAAPIWRVYGWVFGRDGKLLAVDTRFCERCDAPKLRESIRDIVPSLTRQTKDANRTLLVVRTGLPGARISVDERPVGTTEIEVELPPGKHILRVELDGYCPDRREVTLLVGERLEVDVALRPQPKVQVKRSRLVPYSLLGAGVGLGIASGVLFALDQDYATQNGDRLPEHRETTVAAIVTGSAALVAAGVGAYLLITEPAPRWVPVPCVTPDGATLGVVGRF